MLYVLRETRAQASRSRTDRRTFSHARACYVTNDSSENVYSLAKSDVVTTWDDGVSIGKQQLAILRRQLVLS